MVWPTPLAHSAPPLLWGPHYRLRGPSASFGGCFSVQEPVCEKEGKFGRLQNFRGPASKGDCSGDQGPAEPWRREEQPSLGPLLYVALHCKPVGKGLSSPS